MNQTPPDDDSENISPTTSPTSPSPLSKLNPLSSSPQTQIPSPPRSDQKQTDANDAPGKGVTQEHSLVSSKLEDAPSNPPEFPFDAPPGAAGVAPTTGDLVHRIDHLPVAEVGAPTATHEEGNGTTVQAEKTNGGTKGKPPTDAGSSTPPGRRSVQFSRASPFEFPPVSATKSEPQIVEDGDAQGKESHGSKILSKLKALAPSMTMPGHGRSLSGWTNDSSAEGGTTPRSELGELGLHREEDDEDADAEDSPGEMASESAKRRRKARRKDGLATAPTTPRSITSKLPRFHRSATEHSPPNSASITRPSFGFRMNTTSAMSDIPENHRMGFSEDEGRQHLSQRPQGKRPSGLRRLTGMAGSLRAEGSERTLAHWRRADRASSVSAQKWRQLKAGLKLLSAKKKEDSKIDHAKSAELMAELLAGAPAALFLASMFQRDENNRKRIPVLLEQLKIKITDSQPAKHEHDDRHLTFRIELEYASNLVRMKWIINRTWRDFANLHLKYKVHAKSEEIKHGGSGDRNKLPRFPRTAVPYLRNVRGLYEGEGEIEDEELTAGEQSGPDPDASGTDRPGRNKRRRSSFNFMKRTTTAFGSDGLGRLGSTIGGVGGGATGEVKRETYAEKIRKRLELYLQQLIYYVIFRPDSNRLCKFLELSALGVRLAAEGGYHGKEGFMIIKSSKGVDFRKSFKPKPFVDRHRPKWFLVRQGYIVCVDSPDHTIVYDVHLVDPKFSIEKKKTLSQDRGEDENPMELVKRVGNSAKQSHHQLKIRNTERVTKVLAKNERHLRQFEESIRFMVSQSEWSKPHRFDSFAPVRKDVWAQPLVDGRDYMWNVSRAIDHARDVIFIHDWWLSPEIYLRRPAAISQEWRLDRLLKRKADAGVKIFVILYRNVENAIPIDSEHTKNSLINLSETNNISIMRSPHQFKQNTFFWAHHEKLVVVDHCVAFCGGLDLCFGRWDTPGHSVVDDKNTGFEDGDFQRDADACQLWPGKDYSNPRVQDFYALNRPYEEMYDRTKVPRMPWHDVGMQMAGQPARDLSRHFVQRWNFLLRQRPGSRPKPMLLPPPDFLPADLDALDLKGTCEIQLLRSAAEWSLGTPGHIERSVMNAYIESIRESEHFVYIENQFFITTCQTGETRIENGIGDALVERITRAYAKREKWRAIVMIPLMPGFQNTVDATDGTSVRLIMKCQYHSINRGPSSIFQRLLREGIEPRDYIQFYALRSWGKIGTIDKKTLVTEQLYIHAKVMIVDDRIAIIGSANINERSMLGNRDSEVAAIVKDSDRIPSRMAGKEYDVSRFAHELRMRLMREHLGVDVERHPGDAEETFVANGEAVSSAQNTEERLIQNRFIVQESILDAERKYHERRRGSQSPAPDSLTEHMPPLEIPRMNTHELGLPLLSQLPPLPATDDTDIGGPPLLRSFSSTTMTDSHPLLGDMRLPVVTQNSMLDPLNDSFYHNTWHAVAENNTKLFRLVFRCQPDSKVTKWSQYKEYNNFYDRFKVAQHGDEVEKEAAQMAEQSDTLGVAPADAELSEKPTGASGSTLRSQSKRRRRATKGSTGAIILGGEDEHLAQLEKSEAESVLQHIQGHLVEWPYEWLEKEMMNNNWDHAIDSVAPLELYT